MRFILNCVRRFMCAFVNVVEWEIWINISAAHTKWIRWKKKWWFHYKIYHTKGSAMGIVRTNCFYFSSFSGTCIHTKHNLQQPMEFCVLVNYDCIKWRNLTNFIEKNSFGHVIKKQREPQLNPSLKLAWALAVQT